MRAILPAFLLAACATVAPSSAGLPERAAAIRALDASDHACWDMAVDDPQLDCVAGPDRQVRSVRCRAAPEADHRRRVLCTFSGQWVWRYGSRRPYRFGPECAYLSLWQGGIWLVDSVPNPQRCAF
jgi:uncharacterized membrane protein